MKKIILTVFLFLIFSVSSYAQETFYCAFWNVENLFDTIDDPGIDDSEFLPSSEKQWDKEKLNRKLINLSSVIMSMNRGRGPDLLGLCEVENRGVMDSLLIYLSPGYKLLHIESPDGRGIDNALIYRADLFSLISSSSDTIDLGSENTRNILGGRLTAGSDTLSVFVNHWPSRRGGETSEGKRIKAALKLKERIEKTPETDFVIILGDFNDEPEDVSLDSVLSAGNSNDINRPFYNLAYDLSLAGTGSYKYRDTWNMLDQIIINSQNKQYYIEGSFEVYSPYFLITKTGTYAGTAIPTFGGKRYLGGFSDHFPVTAKFKRR